MLLVGGGIHLRCQGVLVEQKQFLELSREEGPLSLGLPVEGISALKEEDIEEASRRERK